MEPPHISPKCRVLRKHFLGEKKTSMCSVDMQQLLVSQSTGVSKFLEAAITLLPIITG